MDHPALWVVPALGFVSFLGNFTLMHFRCGVYEVHLLFLDVTSSMGAMMSCVMSQHRMCTDHMTFYYKRSAGTSFWALLALFSLVGSWFVLQVHPCHLHTASI